MQKVLTGILLVSVLALVGAGCVKKSSSSLESIKTQYPDLVAYVDDIKKWQTQLDADPARIDSYLTLGLAWKSLADRSRDKAHYVEALRVYEAGSKKAEGKNTVLVTNAAKMAAYAGDYPLAEKYYLDAITLAPGETDYYMWLAEFYEYTLKKPSTEIVALLDEGIRRAVINAPLVKYKKNYLERISQ